MPLSLAIGLECEGDRRWLAEVPALSGTLCYGQSRADAIARVQALALRVLAERLERAESPGEALTITFHTA